MACPYGDNSCGGPLTENGPLCVRCYDDALPDDRLPLAEEIEAAQREVTERHGHGLLTTPPTTPLAPETEARGMTRQIASDRVGLFAEAVTTGHPPVSLLACRECGVLLWDVAEHYGHAHPDGPQP